jgi:hypothetical protein
MKTLLTASLILMSFSTIAESINVSSQGSETCEESFELYTDLIFGKDTALKVIPGKVITGECDGESCQTDTQQFKVSLDKKTWNFSVSGPDSAKRCVISKK